MKIVIKSDSICCRVLVIIFEVSKECLRVCTFFNHIKNRSEMLFNYFYSRYMFSNEQNTHFHITFLKYHDWDKKIIS